VLGRIVAFTAGSHCFARHSLRVAKPLLVSRLRSSVSFRAQPHLGRLALGRRSTQKRLLQTVQRCAAAMPMSTMCSQEPGSPRFLTWPRMLLPSTRVYV